MQHLVLFSYPPNHFSDKNNCTHKSNENCTFVFPSASYHCNRSKVFFLLLVSRKMRKRKKKWREIEVITFFFVWLGKQFIEWKQNQETYIKEARLNWILCLPIFFYLTYCIISFNNVFIIFYFFIYYSLPLNIMRCSLVLISLFHI